MNPATQHRPGNAEPAVREDGSQAAQPLVVPFTRASERYGEPFVDTSQQIDASAHQLGPFDVPSYGYLRHLVVEVSTSGGSGGSAAAQADAPWSAISSIQLTDVNGAPIVGPLSGYDLFLINKWGAYLPNSNPAADPYYSAVNGTTGHFAFMLRIPVEFVARDALGALPNQNAAQSYKLSLTLADETAIYSTSPATTLPVARFRVSMECWAPPSETDKATGAVQATQPPAIGTTAYWSKYVGTVNASANTTRLPRVGNMIRNLILVKRDSSGDRADEFGDDLRVEWDAQTMFNRRLVTLQDQAYHAYGLAPDTGVLVLTNTTDFDGAAGDEMRDYYWQTGQATRLDLIYTASAAGSIDVLTNDVAPAGDIFGR